MTYTITNNNNTATGLTINDAIYTTIEIVKNNPKTMADFLDWVGYAFGESERRIVEKNPDADDLIFYYADNLIAPLYDGDADVVKITDTAHVEKNA